MPKCIFGRRTLVIYCLVRLGRLNLTVCIVSSIYSSSLSSAIERSALLTASIAAFSIIFFTISIVINNRRDNNDTSNSSWEALGLLPKPAFS